MSKRVETLIAACFYYSGLVKFARWRQRKARQGLIILNYHCAAGGDLQRHLLYLRRHYRLLHLDTALAELFAPVEHCSLKSDSRMPLVLTFDDGYHDNYRYAMALACKLQIPITIFLVPGYIESGSRFWWLEPDHLVQHAQVSTATVEGRIYHLGRPDQRKALAQAIDLRLRHAASVAEREEFLAAIRKALAGTSSQLAEEKDTLPLTWAEVQEMEQCEWISFGAHTMHHPILAYLTDPVELQYEVSECRRALQERLGRPMRSFAYPVGKSEHVGAMGPRAVQAAGYDWAVTTIDGVNFPQSDPYLLHRFTVDISQHWLLVAAKVSGVWPFFTRLYRTLKSRCTIALLLFLIFILIVPSTLLIACVQQDAGSYATGRGEATFTPSIIPLSAPEIANPWRGAYNWYNNQAVPGWPLIDSYARYAWRTIEPTEGNYDFSQIDQELVLAQASHGKFGFRIMPAEPDTISVPDYLVQLMPHGGWFINAYDGRSAYEPDWNDPDYIARAQALINALGKRYNNDPRLGWIDIFPYGDWGEWHTFGFPNTIASMSAENQQKLIDTCIHAFSNKRIVMFTSDPASLTYALSRSPKIGIRVDCLGIADMGGAVDHLQLVPLAQERWKTAPFIFEFCTGADFQVSLKQAVAYHAAMVSDGNFGPGSYESYTSAKQADLQQTFEASGYRFILNKMTMPSQMRAGARFTVTTSWSNINVAPAYNPWNVMFQLRSPSNSIVWQGKLALDLQTLLPTTGQTTGSNTPLTLADSFSLPDTISAGRYTVAIQVIDPYNYYQPLRLAIQGRNADGSYTLGKIAVI